ncbi:hypothetical protein BJ138DRAFT_1184014 [Hygrophoropsis aurantiaca]|uniref:Uncharacterized protein n=1 Tax=Hygrophoropsis aurantiaca TaxID=72124 RepID=A0ACB7ZUW5_9AGAM|nr:hypothetical protein BJ138DRAFT_1184014 [Hygrophoropsis aurantiaca]
MQPRAPPKLPKYSAVGKVALGQADKRLYMDESKDKKPGPGDEEQEVLEDIDVNCWELFFVYCFARRLQLERDKPEFTSTRTLSRGVNGKREISDICERLGEGCMPGDRHTSNARDRRGLESQEEVEWRDMLQSCMRSHGASRQIRTIYLWGDPSMWVFDVGIRESSASATRETHRMPCVAQHRFATFHGPRDSKSICLHMLRSHVSRTLDPRNSQGNGGNLSTPQVPRDN